MSSAFLYLGIVVMWLCVLVPMWLRRDRHALEHAEPYADYPDGDTLTDMSSSPIVVHPDDDTMDLPVPSGQAPATGVPANPAEDRSATLPKAEAVLRHEIIGSRHERAKATAPQAGEAWERPPEEQLDQEPQDEEPQEQEALGADAAPERLSPAESRRRARVMARRRRWLLWSVLLHAGTYVACITGWLPWWALTPSVLVLAGYLMMLRVAVSTDRDRRAAAARAHAEQERRAREHREAEELAAQQAEADVLEFRRRAEPFDQYADRHRRAVGD
ncbi:hypothetical protein [Sphaerisporangium aureirubrum]|uniref:Uncharacterized protein n=1 Tax=Sphaerisporangium aureirubrum TaxID=1544736 RepID=A0ABW1NVF8_9ACTN